MPLSKPATPTIGALLDAARDRLDQLVGTVEGGIRGPDHFDHLEEQATAIAGSIRDAFRRGAR